MSRGSFFRVSPTSEANGDAVTSASRTRRPSALDTTFWLTTTMSSAASGVAWAAAAATSNAPRSSPLLTVGRPQMPQT